MMFSYQILRLGTYHVQQKHSVCSRSSELPPELTRRLHNSAEVTYLARGRDSNDFVDDLADGLHAEDCRETDWTREIGRT